MLEGDPPKLQTDGMNLAGGQATHPLPSVARVLQNVPLYPHGMMLLAWHARACGGPCCFAISVLLLTSGAELQQSRPAWWHPLGLIPCCQAGMAEHADLADLHRLETNDISATLHFLGVEAARAALVREVRAVFGAYGIAVDARHLSLIADFMTAQARHTSHKLNDDFLRE